MLHDVSDHEMPCFVDAQISVARGDAQSSCAAPQITPTVRDITK